MKVLYSGADVIKYINVLNNPRVFVPGKPFQPSLMFVGKATLKWSTFNWVGSGLISNIRLGRRGSSGKNTIAITKIRKLRP